MFHVRVGDEVETEDQLAAAELQIEMAHWSPRRSDRSDVGRGRVASASGARCRG